eukprot:9497067-Pyramimonas_sp.AAC.2
MSWLMKRESAIRRAQPQNCSDGVAWKDSLECVTLSSSPIVSALGEGALALGDGGPASWRLFFAYNPIAHGDAILEIWKSMLPVLGRMYIRGIGLLESWPIRLIRLLSDDLAVRDETADAFANSPLCCVPFDVKPLREAVACKADCIADDFLTCIREFANQVELTNFCQEVSHSQMRHLLESGQGKSMAFEGAALGLFGHQMGATYDSESPASPSAPRGRPASETVKRSRCDGWNAYVAMHKPFCAPGKGGAIIKSGDHMKQLATQWKDLQGDRRKQYDDIALAEKVKRGISRMDSNQEGGADEGEDGGQQEALNSPWSLSSKDGPLSPDLMCEPCFTRELAGKMDTWKTKMCNVVKHDKNALPFKNTSYCNACHWWICKKHVSYLLAIKMAGNIRKRSDVCSAYLLVAAGHRTLFHTFFMIVHKTVAPNRLVMIHLDLADESTVQPNDLDRAVGFPWSLKFQRATVGGQQILAFDVDEKYFLDVYVRCGEEHVDDIYCRRLEYVPSSIDHLDVSSAGQKVSLLSALMGDMREIQDDGGPGPIEGGGGGGGGTEDPSGAARMLPSHAFRRTSHALRENACVPAAHFGTPVIR